MFGSGMGSSFLMIIVGVIILFVIISRIRTNTTLVLKRFDINPDEEEKIYITGRKGGLWGWILDLLKLDTEYKLVVTEKDICFSGKSVFGESMLLTPLKRVASTFCGYTKPIMSIVVGIVLILGGISLYGWLQVILIIIGVIMIITYFFNKQMTISIESSGSRKVGISFKRSFIENVDVDIEKVKETISLINNLILTRS